MRASLLPLILIAIVTTTCPASEVVWGFDGVVTFVGNDNPPSDLKEGLRFSGTIDFDTEPVGSTLYDPTYQSFAWQAESVGIRLQLGGVDFSTSARPQTFLQMTIGNNHFGQSLFGSHYDTNTDSLFVGAGSDMYESPPRPPGEPGIDYVTYLRNVNMEFQDFDQLAFSSVSLVTSPFDIRQMEVRRIVANVSLSGGSPGVSHVIHGDIDQLYLVPEPSTSLFLAVSALITLLRRARASCRPPATSGLLR